jgi:hypothetical protein
VLLGWEALRDPSGEATFEISHLLSELI